MFSLVIVKEQGQRLLQIHLGDYGCGCYTSIGKEDCNLVFRSLPIGMRRQYHYRIEKALSDWQNSSRITSVSDCCTIMKNRLAFHFRKDCPGKKFICLISSKAYDKLYLIWNDCVSHDDDQYPF